MPRDLPLGNGSLLVAFDREYYIRDFYFPHVGQEDHTAGHYFRLGVWLDGKFSWVHEPPWQRDLRYEPRTLVTAVTLVHPDWDLVIRVQDAVDFHENLLVRHFQMNNRHNENREVRLFLCHDFHINGVDVGDTAFYDPMTQAVIHYKGERYFLIGGQQGDHPGVISWATGAKGVPGAEGTWRDAEDGILERNPIAQGSVDSAVCFSTTVPGGGTGDISAWICVGKHLEEVRRLHGLVQYKTPAAILDRTRAYWRLWAEKEQWDLDGLPPTVVEQLYRSLVILRTQIDNTGAILAANDSDTLHYNWDTYSYFWPRDGAMVTAALDLAGYRDLAAGFFAFCDRVMEEDGFFLHKYNPDGCLSSSWHPWIRNGVPELPIQEDETALIPWALWHHFRLYRDVEVVGSHLRRLVLQVGRFLTGYRDPESHLPLESWDLWEERRGVHAYTVATVYGGLTAAAHLAVLFGEEEEAQRFRTAAQEVQVGVSRFLHPELGVYVRRLVARPDGGYDRDDTPDSSLLLLPRFGLVAADDPVMVRTADWVREKLWVPTAVGGLARYRGDAYQQRSPASSEVPGNPWFLCTLWHADYLIARAKTAEDLQAAVEGLLWVVAHAAPSGVLAEQIDPYTGEPVSVAPLTWSHAAFVTTVLTYRERMAHLRNVSQRGGTEDRMEHGRELA